MIAIKNSPHLQLDHYKRFAFVILLCFPILFASYWSYKNINFVPKYGDTVEYLQLADSLHVDKYRTVLYPLILKVVKWIFGSNWLPALYISQAATSFLSTFYFMATISKICNNKDLKLNFYSQLIVALFITCTPLLNHYNLSVLTDSVASSLFIFSVAVFLRLIFLPNTNYIIPLLLLSSTLLSVIRPDKSYVIILMTLFLTIKCIYSAAKRNHRGQLIKDLVFILILLVAITSAKIINHNTQRSDYGRPPLALPYIMFNKIVWGNLLSIYDDLPQGYKLLFSKNGARHFDSHNNNVIKFMVALKLKTKSSDWNKVTPMLNEMSIISLKKNYSKIIKNSFSVLFNYVLAPYDFTISKRGASRWNYTRMNMKTPKITDYYLHIGAVYLWIASLLALLIFIFKFHIYKRLLTVFAIPFILFIANMSIYSFLTSAPFNIRYAISSYVLFFSFLLFVIASYLNISKEPPL